MADEAKKDPCDCVQVPDTLTVTFYSLPTLSREDMDYARRIQELQDRYGNRCKEIQEHQDQERAAHRRIRILQTQIREKAGQCPKGPNAERGEDT